jgi:hypothetical protein
MPGRASTLTNDIHADFKISFAHAAHSSPCATAGSLALLRGSQIQALPLTTPSGRTVRSAAAQPSRPARLGVSFLAGGSGTGGSGGVCRCPRIRSALVPLTAIIVHVMRPGRRADELLAAVAKDLGRGTLIPDERGHVRILLEESEGAAWQRIHDALDAAGDDWHEHLHVNPRPG